MTVQRVSKFRTSLLMSGRVLATIVLASCFFTTASSGADDEPVFSGPQPGEVLPALSVRELLVEKPADAPRDIDLIQAADGGPVLIVFFHQRTRPAFGLANALLRLPAELKDTRLHASMVFLTADPTETETWVTRVRNLFPAGSRYGVSMDGIEGPGSYGLNRDVALTVLIGKQGRVTASFALIQPDLTTDGARILKAVSQVLENAAVPDIQSLSGQRAVMQRVMPRPAADGAGGAPAGANVTRSNPTGSEAPQPAPDEYLSGLLRQLINRTALPDEVDRTAVRILAYTQENPEAGRTLGRIAHRIVSAGVLDRYGTPEARIYLAAWAREYARPAPPLPQPRTLEAAR